MKYGVFFLGISLFGIGCSSTDQQVENVVSIDEFLTNKLGTSCTQTVVDATGQRWIPLLQSSLAKQLDPSYVKPRPNEMNVEELAEALRPVTVMNGCQYTHEKAPLAWAQEAMANAGNAQLFDGSKGSAPTEDNNDDIIVPPTGYSTQGVIGTDSRVKRRDNTSYPMRTQIYYRRPSTGGSCSGTLIGPSTALTAAHCMHDGTNYKGNIEWTTGADKDDTVKYPYAPTGAYPSTNSANPLISCFTWWLPGGWIGADEDWDFVVFEFKDMGGQGPTGGCGISPGSTVGWLGWGYMADATIEANTHWLYGYPANDANFTCGQSGSCAGGACNDPTIWGIGENNVDPDWSYRLNYYIDAGGGQSGSGVYNNTDGTRRVMAVHTGCQNNLFGDYNFGRRIDSAAITFIQNTSAL